MAAQGLPAQSVQLAVHLRARDSLIKRDATVPRRLNASIQATGADGLKKAMVLPHERVKPLCAHIVLAVHDEILVEAPEARAEEVRLLVHATMVKAMQGLLGAVPVEVKSSVRTSWPEEA